MATDLERKYAKVMFSEKDRMALYRKLAALNSNGVPIKDALVNLYKRVSRNGAKKSDPKAIVLSEWIAGIANGKSAARSMGDWIPSSERMIIEAGERGGALPDSLASVEKVASGAQEMRKAVLGGLFQPVMLFIAAIGVIALFGVKVIPMFSTVSSPETWSTLAYSLYVASEVVKSIWFYVILGSIIGFAFFIIMTLPYFKGKNRYYFDKIPPWSIYRLWIGSGFILSLSSMVKAGIPIKQALTDLKKQASPYLAVRIEAGIRGLREGSNLGEAFAKSGYGFPDEEIIDDLIVYSSQGDLDAALEKIGNEWLKEGVKVVQLQSAIMNTVAKTLMSLIVVWITMGTFDLQQSISDAVQTQAR